MPTVSAFYGIIIRMFLMSMLRFISTRSTANSRQRSESVS